MSPSSETAGEFFDIIGRLRRSANTASRYGQVDELQKLADELIRWQAHVRTAICRALEINPPTSVSWETMIERVQNEHDRAERRSVSPTQDALDGVIKP